MLIRDDAVLELERLRGLTASLSKYIRMPNATCWYNQRHSGTFLLRCGPWKANVVP